MYLLIISRVIFGGYFIINGVNHLTHTKELSAYAASKRVPSSRLAVVIGGLMIILGGAGIMLALYVPVAVALVVIFLLAVTFMMHNFWANPDSNMRSKEQIEFMKNMALLAGALAYLFV